MRAGLAVLHAGTVRFTPASTHVAHRHTDPGTLLAAVRAPLLAFRFSRTELVGSTSAVVSVMDPAVTVTAADGPVAVDANRPLSPDTVGWVPGFRASMHGEASVHVSEAGVVAAAGTDRN